ncbi:MAG: TetR DNA-binding transcription regulator [Actinomycetia bacterium]|nr:TetR DNA-binding transcription regulator [Actinomycetes bacterium]
MLTKGERTRGALVQAAITRFARDGYRATTLSSIAEDAGISPTAVYRHFPDKDAMFEAAVDADAEGMVGLARDAINGDTEGDLLALLNSLSDVLAAAVTDHPLVGRVLAGLDVLSPDRILALPSLAQLRSDLTELIRFGQAADLVRPTLDPANAALGLETLVLEHVAYLVTVGGPTNTSDERWAAVVSLLEVALRP